MKDRIRRLVGRVKHDDHGRPLMRVPRTRFLPVYRNSGQRPERKTSEWNLVANRADRRFGRAGKVRYAGRYQPRTSPRMRHGIDSTPRLSVVQRHVRRAAALASAAGLPDMNAEQLRLLANVVGRPGASYRGRGA